MTPAPATAPLIVGLDPGKYGAVVAVDIDGRTVLAERCPLFLDCIDVRGMAEIGDRIRALGTVVAFWSEEPIATYRRNKVDTGYAALKRSVKDWTEALRFGRPTEIAPNAWQGRVLGTMPPDRAALDRGLKLTKAQAIAWCRSEARDLDLRPGKCRHDHDGLADARAVAEYGRRWWRVMNPGAVEVCCG